MGATEPPPINAGISPRYGAVASDDSGVDFKLYALETLAREHSSVSLQGRRVARRRDCRHFSRHRDHLYAVGFVRCFLVATRNVGRPRRDSARVVVLVNDLRAGWFRAGGSKFGAHVAGTVA